MGKNGFAITGAITVIVLAFGMIFLAPLAYIWGWNQLFGKIYLIDYSFWNWLAVVVLSMFFKTTYSYKKSA